MSDPSGGSNLERSAFDTRSDPELVAALRPHLVGVTRPAAAGVGPRELRRRPEGWDDRPYEGFDVTPEGVTLGATIAGVDLGAELDDHLIGELRRALLEWKVLFFRGQDLSAERHAAFAARFGELEQHPFLPSGDTPTVVRFEKTGASRNDYFTSGVENGWHADVTWRECPAMGAVLRAVEVPETGGDTLFTDAAVAYDNLPAALRELIDPLVAEHSFVSSFGRTMSEEEVGRMREVYPPVQHPVVRTHPETGRRTLFVNGYFTDRIVGLDRETGDALIDRLNLPMGRPEWTVRLRWDPGTVAFWDNRAVQHYAASDYFPQRRVMERIAIVGDRPT